MVTHSSILVAGQISPDNIPYILEITEVHLYITKLMERIKDVSTSVQNIRP